MELKQTTKYGMFKKLLGNRDINEAHVRELEASFDASEHGNAADPLIVNDEYQIIDGQHTLEAMERLNKPVYYLVIPGLGLETVHRMNTKRRSWRPIDFARSYAAQGNEHYITYVGFAEDYSVRHGLLLRVLANPKNMWATEQANGFRVGKFTVGRDIQWSHDFFQELTNIKQFYGGWQGSAFGIAFLRLYTDPKFKLEVWTEQLKKGGYKLTSYSKWDAALKDLEELYNAGLQAKDKIDTSKK